MIWFTPVIAFVLGLIFGTMSRCSHKYVYPLRVGEHVLLVCCGCRRVTNKEFEGCLPVGRGDLR